MNKELINQIIKIIESEIEEEHLPTHSEDYMGLSGDIRTIDVINKARVIEKIKGL